MMEVRNESVGGGGSYGFGNCGWGGNGIVDLIALMAVFRGNMFDGNYREAGVNIAEIQNQLGNIRADIGDVKYDSLNSVLNQTIGLMGEISQGRYENLKSIYDLSNHMCNEFSDMKSAIDGTKYDLSTRIDDTKYSLGSKVDNNRYELGSKIDRIGCENNLNITKMGYENQLSNERQTNILSRQQADCCCETKGLIRDTAHETQLRDLQYKCDTDAKLEKLACGQDRIMAEIKENRLLEEIARLKDKNAALNQINERGYIHNEVNRAVSLGAGHWSADAQFNGVTYPQPPFTGVL